MPRVVVKPLNFNAPHEIVSKKTRRGVVHVFKQAKLAHVTTIPGRTFEEPPPVPPKPGLPPATPTSQFPSLAEFTFQPPPLKKGGKVGGLTVYPFIDRLT